MSKGPIRTVPPFLALLFVPAMQGATIYGYTGNPFTNVSGTFTTSMRITGAFTLDAPLADNLSDAEVSSTDYTFFNGIDTDSKSPIIGSQFIVSTDGIGAITAWTIQVGGVALITSCSNSVVPVPVCASPTRDGTVTAHGFAFVEGSAGSWTSNQTPEPSAFTLLLETLVCAGVFKLATKYSAKLTSTAQTH